MSSTASRTPARTSPANPPYTPEEIERYEEAWSQPGAAAGMINYYRASVRQSQKEAAAKLRPISAPTLVIWGERDSYLGSELAEPEHDDVPNLEGVESAWPTPRTGCITTRLNASTNCLSTSSVP
jgi:pimeloyl-ACP methyl ester carboxylesterase